jgi:hypothetical protein
LEISTDILVTGISDIPVTNHSLLETKIEIISEGEMEEYLGPISFAYTLLKDTIVIALKRQEVVENKEFQRKILSIHNLMFEIIDNAEKIFDLISSIKTSETNEQHDTILKIKALAHSQTRAIEKLGNGVYDDTWFKLFRHLMPDLRKKIHDPMFIKGERLRILLRTDDLNYEELRNLYNDSYLHEGREIIENLKATSEEVSQAIKAKISLKDLTP